MDGISISVVISTLADQHNYLVFGSYSISQQFGDIFLSRSVCFGFGFYCFSGFQFYFVG